MEFRQLEYLVAVADEGSFTAAAAALGVSQPSVSQGLRALENELGVALVERLPRGSVLTTAGRALLPSAQASLRDMRSGRSAIEAVRGVESGTLDVVCLPTLAAEPTARLVGALRRRHPGLSVRIAQPETVADLLDRIRDGRSELAVTELTGDLDGLAAHELETQDFVALVPAGEGGPPLTAAALAKVPIITAPGGTSTRRQLEEVYEVIGRTPRVVVETEHREAMAALVAAGAGVALVPRPAAAPSPATGVEIVELARPVRRRIGLVHRTGPLAPAAQALLALALPGRRPAPGRPRARRRSGS
jgi:LysR family transcriptional regulator, carnitine catabolism transcriptional activator